MAPDVVLSKNCEHQNPCGSKFCIACGKPIDPIEAVECPTCHKVVPATSRFCMGCGSPLADTSRGGDIPEEAAESFEASEQATLDSLTSGVEEQGFSAQSQGQFAVGQTQQMPSAVSQESVPQTAAKKSKTPLIAGIAAVCAVVLIGAGAFFFLGRGSSSDQSSPVPTDQGSDESQTAPKDFEPTEDEQAQLLSLCKGYALADSIHAGFSDEETLEAGDGTLDDVLVYCTLEADSGYADIFDASNQQLDAVDVIDELDVATVESSTALYGYSYYVDESQIAPILKSYYGSENAPDPKTVANIEHYSYFGGEFFTKVSRQFWAADENLTGAHSCLWATNYQQVETKVQFDLAVCTGQNIIAKDGFTYYRVVAEPDDDSLFGYHLVSFAAADDLYDEFDNLDDAIAADAAGTLHATDSNDDAAVTEETSEDEQIYNGELSETGDGLLYTNSRFGFSVTLPSGFERKESSDNDGGIVVYDSATGMTVNFAGYNNPGETIESILGMYRDQPSADVYEASGDGWLVYSYRDGDTIFYMKDYVGAGSINSITFSYPKDAPGSDEILESILDGFTPGDTSVEH